MGRRSTGLIVGILGSMAVACSPQAGAGMAQEAEAETGAHPVSGLEIIPVVVATEQGSHTFRTELANTPELQAKGLMFRTELGPDEAMLFPNEEPTARSFWMKNTPIPLDIIFVGLDGRIANIAAMAEPYSEDPVYSIGSTSAVLEIAGGRAEELGIEAGDRVTW